MGLKNLTDYLKKWQKAGLINEEQAKKITDYMHAELNRQFLKLIRIFFILGVFWLIFGLATTLKLINIETLIAIGRFLYNLVTPIIALAKLISPERYRQLLGGVSCLLGWGLFHWLGIKFRRESELTTTKLEFFQEKELQIGIASFTVGYILASAGWLFFSYMLYPTAAGGYWGKEFIFPLFSFAGTIFFLAIAYSMRDQIALLFGIGFLARTIGLFTAYFVVRYLLGVQHSVAQFIAGLLLVYVGLWHVEKARGKEKDFRYLFGRTYEWTGLLLLFISLWIMSIWGITYGGRYWTAPIVYELWITNIIFIVGSLLTMWYGALKEDRTFLNFGFTFFVIEIYTLFFCYVWVMIGAAFSALLLGIILFVTGYVLRHLWLKGHISKKFA